MPRKKEVQEHYDEVASLYDQGDVTYPHVRAQLLRHLSEKNGVMLDVGCGTGKILLELGRNSRNAVGVDISPVMLRRALRRIKRHPNLHLVRCDGECLPFKRALFDNIVCTEVIEHLETPKHLLNEMARVLKPHGRVFLTTPNTLWSAVLHIAERFRVKVAEGPTRHLSPWGFRRLIGTSNLRLQHYEGTMFFPWKVWKFMEKLSEALNRSKLRDFCLKQIAICTKRLSHKPYFKGFVSLVLPMHNEAKNVRRCVGATESILRSITESYEIIISEDGSSDGSDIICRQIISENQHILHIHSDKRLRRGRALKRAFMQAKGDVLLYMDADLATDTRILPDLIAAAWLNKGISVASRLVSGAKVMRRHVLREITSRTYNWFIQFLFHDGVNDHQCGCKAFHKDMIRDLLDEVKSPGWFWDTEIIVRAKRKGYSVVEIPCTWSEPSNRKSKVNIFRDAITMGMSAIKLYREVR